MYENYLAHYGVKGMRWGQRKRHTIIGSGVRLAGKNVVAGSKYVGRVVRHPVKQGLSGKSQVRMRREMSTNHKNFAKDITKNRKEHVGIRRGLARQSLGISKQLKTSANAYEKFRKNPTNIGKALNAKANVVGQMVLNSYFLGYGNISTAQLRKEAYQKG